MWLYLVKILYHFDGFNDALEDYLDSRIRAQTLIGDPPKQND